MNYGFIKVAAASPAVTVANPEANSAEIVALAKVADSRGVKLAVFPELSVTGATCGDLFFYETLISGAVSALFEIASETALLDTVIVVGAPIKRDFKLYNCAVVIYRGEILGIVPKTVTAASRIRGMRAFADAPEKCGTVELGGIPYPFGKRMLFYCEELHDFNFTCDFEDGIAVTCPPSTENARAGANIICCLGSSPENASSDAHRCMLFTSHSARTHSACIFADSGFGESTTDGVFGAHRMVAESGKLISENKPFDFSDLITVTDIDVKMLTSERVRDVNFLPIEVTADNFYCVGFCMEPTETLLTREIPKSPFIPGDPELASKRFDKLLSLQAAGLAKRMIHTASKCAVVGISGGLDSCLALICAVKTMDMLKRPHTDVIAVTMPCFGTTGRTYGNALKLCEELGVSLKTIDIREAVLGHFADIGHSETLHDTVYENAQARQRTLVLMDLANKEGGMVIGTGDLSELCLGFATYNGDHMSMYGVNASLPKTLIRALVKHYAERCGNGELSAVLLDIVDTPVSPELLPSDGGEIGQITEKVIGPYELHDFFIYYFLRYGFEKGKILHMAEAAFSDSYESEEINGWLDVFLKRFFSSQFKRSCLPDGPCTGSVNVSPREGLFMPSDASYKLWML